MGAPSIQSLARHRRRIAIALALLFTGAIADIPALAGSDPPIRITHQDVRIEGDVVVITYNLEAPEGTPCTVTVELRKESDPSFSFVPRSLTGDIGDVKTAGTGKTVRWEYLKEFPVGLRGDDYYFTLQADKAGGFPWFWVGLGAAATVGATVVLFAGKTTSAGTQGAPQELPLPPAR
ncbi:MAG TPA: hypothetical protein VMM80_05155 [Bacteroidota bacterium]|nr:hypothetical protein [Bacteroidota bacterium]